MVDVVEELDPVPGQDVVVVVGVGGVPPPQAEEDRERAAEADEVLYPEHEAALGGLRRGPEPPGAGAHAAAPGVLHVLTPPGQHVVGDNTACNHNQSAAGSGSYLLTEKSLDHDNKVLLI